MKSHYPKAGARKTSAPKFLGEKYGRLTVTARDGEYALCQCDCGDTANVRMDRLRRDKTKSCGCYARDLADSLRKPPAPPKLKPAPLAHASKLRPIWSAMRQRCTNPNHKDYARYGGRGIQVAAEWGTFEKFYAWAMSSYSTGLWLDRRDNNGPYSPDNCWWRSPAQQATNRSNTLRVGDAPLVEVIAGRNWTYHQAYVEYQRIKASGREPTEWDFPKRN